MYKVEKRSQGRPCKHPDQSVIRFQSIVVVRGGKEYPQNRIWIYRNASEEMGLSYPGEIEVMISGNQENRSIGIKKGKGLKLRKYGKLLQVDVTGWVLDVENGDYYYAKTEVKSGVNWYCKK